MYAECNNDVRKDKYMRAHIVILGAGATMATIPMAIRMEKNQLL